MKWSNKWICLFLMMLCVGVEAKVMVYPFIKDKVLNEDDKYEVFVRSKGGSDEWTKVQTITVDVDMDTRSKAAMAQFDMDAPVEIKVIVCKTAIDDVMIRPLSRKVGYKRFDDHTIVFELARPGKLSVEINGDRKTNLHLFANELVNEAEVFDGIDEENIINWSGGTKDIFRKDCRLICFEAGVHQPKDLPNNEIRIPSNCTVYLAPGALVKAKLRVEGARNVRIIGRGYLFQPLRGVEITHSKNVEVRGITVINPMHYTIFGGESRNVTIDNVKGFSSRGWSDGIDLMSCRDWKINDVFLRTSDDCLAFYNHRWWFWGNSKDIEVTNAVLWADVAHAINIGGHGDDKSKKGEVISNIVCKSIDVLNVDEDDDDYRGVMSVCSGDNNQIKNILFEDIRVEDCEEARLIDIRVVFNEKYNTVPGGRIEKVVFRNVTYDGNEEHLFPMRIKGYDKTSDVRGVVLENINLNGRKFVDFERIETNEFVSDVSIN